MTRAAYNLMRAFSNALHLRFALMEKLGSLLPRTIASRPKSCKASPKGDCVNHKKMEAVGQDPVIFLDEPVIYRDSGDDQ